jgi:nucleoside-diphosphate-sugar epimerase
LRGFGVEPVIADAFDSAAVKAAVEQIRPDAVINELTSLPRHYTPAEMKAAAERDRKVKVEGNINLLAALRDAGVRRYLLQSSGFWYAPGAGLADESAPFVSSASPGVEAGARTYVELEARASTTPGIEFVALRYGFFYGPGTWYTHGGDMGEQVRRQQVPIIGEGQGVYSFVHIDDAAGATAVASARVADGVCACGRSTGATSRQRGRGASGVGPRRGLLRDAAQGRLAREGPTRARVPSARARVDLSFREPALHSTRRSSLTSGNRVCLYLARCEVRGCRPPTDSSLRPSVPSRG